MSKYNLNENNMDVIMSGATMENNFITLLDARHPEVALTDATNSYPIIDGIATLRSYAKIKIDEGTMTLILHDEPVYTRAI